MSKRGREESTEPGHDQSIWVMTDWDVAHGGYCLAVHFSDDTSHSLTPEQAVAYAVAVTEASAAASYDAAVFTQLTTKLKMPLAMVGEVLKHMRARRKKDTWRAGPMTLQPGISAFTGKPFLTCRAAGLRWQWDPSEAQQHARHVLEAVTGADLDTNYFRTLTEDFEIGMDRATQVVHDVGSFRSE
jgi:hypothetical protein